MRGVARHLLRLSLLAAFALAVGCGAVAKTSEDGGSGGPTGTSGGAMSDGGAIAIDAARDATLPTLPDGGAFCSGDTPRLLINGADAQIFKTNGKAVALNCCDSAELEVATSTFQALMYVMWRSPAGMPPATIDLVSPPAGFAIELDVGCDPATTSCTSASEERYTDGFTGSLSYTTAASGVTTSYCLSVVENPASPHSVIHSLSLYAPNVVAAF